MSDEIPQWAKERACELANAEQSYELWKVRDIDSKMYPVMTTLARYIAQHEEPPVDANLQMARDSAAEATLAARLDDENSKQWAIYCRDGAYDDGREVQSALIAIRKLKEARNG